jgi:glycosyltransferase involved in cell wall biosynthesis
MDPLVSVVIPCYAQAHFLADAVQSVLGQSHPAVELIVVNDGSPDATAMAEVLAPVLDRIVYITQENRGLGEARNVGLNRCRGEYVVFLDADDRLLPNALAEGARALATRPACGLVWGLRHFIDAKGSLLRQHVGGMGTRERYVDLLQTNIVGAPVSVMWRRSVLTALGGFSRVIRPAEDYDAYLRVARQHEIHCHGATVAEYRLHSANMSGNASGMLAGVMAALDGQVDWIGQDTELRRALQIGRRDARDRYDWSPRLDQLRIAVRERQWLRAWTAAALLFGRYPLKFMGLLTEQVRRRSWGFRRAEREAPAPRISDQ